ARQEAYKATIAADKERDALAQSDRSLYLAHMKVVQEAWSRADIPAVMDLLKRHIPKPGAADHRGFEWYYHWRLCHSELFTLRGLPGPVRSVAFSPDGKALAIACEVPAAWPSTAGSVFLWDPAQRQPPTL